MSLRELTYTDSTGAERLAVDHLACGAGDAPCSRYGVRSEDHTPVILATARILADSTGELTADSLDHCASLVVNDHEDPALMIASHGTPEERATLEPDVLFWAVLEALPCPEDTGHDHTPGLGLCQWFARCDREARTLVDHPILYRVPACYRCADFARGDS